MDANTSIGLSWWEERTLGVVTLIVVSTALVFYLDLITPLGLTVWILYFIPLYMTFYVRWPPMPFAATAVFLALIAATSVLSYRDVSLAYALLNRLFFGGMLVVSAGFIWNARRGVERLQMSEERHRVLFEASLDPILVSAGNRVLYANPAGERMFADADHALIGRGFAELVDPAERESVCARLRQATQGARMHLCNIGMTTLDGRPLRADAALSEIVWDGAPALEIVIRSSARLARGARPFVRPASPQD
jgi:PAS domain S-box-containing protein